MEGKLKKRPDKFWKKLLAITLRLNTFYGSQRKYYFDCAEIPRCEVELINISKIDDRLKPIEILLKYFCHTEEDAKRLRRKPTQVRKMIGWKVEDGNVDELMQDVIYTMEKDRSLFEAEMKRYYQGNRHPKMHLCQRSGALSRLACCHFVKLLNDTNKVPFCDSEFMKNDTKRLEPVPNVYSTPVYLNFPADVPEDHATFFLGIILLISIAVFCAIVIMKLTKPKVGFARLPSGFSFNGPLDYDIMMWLPRHQRRNSVMLFLRSMGCRPGGQRTRQTSLSVVSSSSIGLLPSYRSATTSSTITPTSIPPPPYEELESLTTSTRASYISCSSNNNIPSSR